MPTPVDLALIGYGSVARALARLIDRKRNDFPFRIAAVHTARHGTAYSPDGLPLDPPFGPAAATVEEFLTTARLATRQAPVCVELSTLNPGTGEPAIRHVRAALERGMHVVTANKGPIAHAYAALHEEACRRGLLFRFEAAVMDGTPIFNLIRHTQPGVRVLGFTGVLNSTSKIVVETMERGGSFDDGVKEAQRLGIAEADATYDTDGWDSAAKTAALANVLMDARTTPQAVSTRGIGRLTIQRVQELARQGKTVRLVSRAKSGVNGISLRVRAEVLDKTDLLACVGGTSNLLLFHTDLMGTFGAVSIAPGVDQTAYGVFADLVDVARAMGYTH